MPVTLHVFDVHCFFFIAYKMSTVSSRASCGATYRPATSATGSRRYNSRTILPNWSSTLRWKCGPRTWRWGPCSRPGANADVTMTAHTKWWVPFCCWWFSTEADIKLRHLVLCVNPKNVNPPPLMTHAAHEHHFSHWNLCCWSLSSGQAPDSPPGWWIASRHPLTALYCNYYS